MTDTEIKNIVVETVERLVCDFLDADLKTKYPVDFPTVKFDLEGTSAGLCEFKQSTGTAVLRFNMTLLRDNFDEYMDNIVPHEVAHYCTDAWKGIMFDRAGRCIHHGKHWKMVMWYFGYEPKTTHSMNVTKVKRGKNYRLFEYKCSCQTHQVTSIIHNRCQKGKKYVCTNCKQNLEFVKELKKK